MPNTLNTNERVAVVSNGRYTIQNKETREHRTFRIRTIPANSNWCPGKRVVDLLTGSDNEHDYRGFAFIDDRRISVWRKYITRTNGHRTAYEYYAGMLWSLATEGEQSRWAAKYRLLVRAKCLRCNRTLTDPVSITIGVGPVCRGER